jgi:hypothetical protein
LEKERKKFKSIPKYFVFSEYELLFLIICIILDISEYVVTILLQPWLGDLLDIVGIVACLLMFRLEGVISLLELVPGLDVLPIFIITWVIWYYLKRQVKQTVN